jgi:hypothetical protein
MRATGRMTGLRKLQQYPFDTCGVKGRIDFNGRVTGDGGGNARAEGGKVLILGWLIGIRGGLVNDFAEHALESRALKADRSGFDGEGLGPEGLNFKAVALELFCDARKYNHLLGFELNKQRHEEALALNFFNLAGAKNFFKKNAFVSDVLVDYPQTVLAGGQDERLAKLAKWS